MQGITVAQDEQVMMSALQVFPKIGDVYQAITQSQGDSSQEIRQRIMSYANNPTREALHKLPTALQTYIQKVVEASYKVTDSDICYLIDNGYSEDFVFEITIVASVGAGLRRLSSGIEALS